MNRRYTKADMQLFAEAIGGAFRSETYTAINKKHLWECGHGHLFEATPHNVMKGKWCAECFGNRRKTINFFKEKAKERAGECLTGTYSGSKVRLHFRCKHGHEWKALPYEITKGRWCARCMGNKRTLDDYIKMANQKGGQILTQEYVNARTHLEIRCEQGHIFKMRPTNLQQGRWCRQCDRLKKKSSPAKQGNRR